MGRAGKCTVLLVYVRKLQLSSLQDSAEPPTPKDSQACFCTRDIGISKTAAEIYLAAHLGGERCCWGGCQGLLKPRD